MGELLAYSITCGLTLLLLYLAYCLVLARYNQHSFNRGVLLMIYCVAFAGTPALISLIDAEPRPAGKSIILDNVGNIATAGVALTKPIWGTILIWIFISGMAVATINTVVVWIRLTKIIRAGERIERDGYTLVVTDDDRFAPFSWMRYIVISRQDYTSGNRAIVTHELKHITSLHWLDLMIAQAVCILNWFNPAAWLMRNELMLVHEYQADRAVMDRGLDAREYQMLLIKKAVGARFPSLANSLNHSKLKKRITMMYKEKSGAGRRLNALALVPVLALALAVASAPAVRAVVSTIGNSPVTVDKVSENPSEDKTAFPKFKVTEISNDGRQTTIVLRSNNAGNQINVSGGVLSNGGKRYEASSLQTQLVDGKASITVTFPFAGEYKRTGMVLTINGETVPFRFEDLSAKADQSAPGDSTARVSFVINDSSSPLLDGMEIYVNGEKINREQIDAIAPDDIASMTVDSQKNAILIQLKK